jgi:ATP-binding cassette, subfamily B, bacterial HlyB/CyaB
VAAELFDQQLVGHIAKILGEDIPQKDLVGCLAWLSFQEPPVIQMFWQSRIAHPGIYIVLAGKVRLVDTNDNLITSLSVGSSFGEITFFSQKGFISYAARASTNLQVAYIQEDGLRNLIQKYPEVLYHLQQRAEIWNLLLQYRQNNPTLAPAMAEEILKGLCLFERYELTPGPLNKQVDKDNKLWSLSNGRLQYSDGKVLTPGYIYGLTKVEKLQVSEPTILYGLKNANWEKAIEESPELEKFVNPNAQISAKDRQRRPKRDLPITDRKVIPFAPPQKKEPQQQSQEKKQRPYFPSPKVATGHLWAKVTQRYPYYAQQSASDCGAACLVMISRYWGKKFSVNRLREMANVGRSGASMKAISNTAEAVGFTSRPVKASLGKLAEQSLPAIAHWEGKHFIVVYKITQTHVIVGDPAIGQRNLTYKEFETGWTGYALLLQPTAELKETKDAKPSLWNFYQLVKPHWKILLEVFLASVLMQIFGLITPIFTQLLLDRVIVQGSVSTLNAVSLGMLIFGLFSLFINSIRQYLLDHTANRVSVALLVGFIKHTFRLPMAYFESRYVGDIVSRIQENHKIQRFLTGESLLIVLDLLTVTIYLGMMFSYSWRMAVLALLTVPPFFILALASTNILRRMSREIFSAGAEENSYLIQALTGIRSVRSMAIEQTVRWHWEELLNKLIKKGFEAQIIGNRLQVVSGSIDIFMSTGLLWYGAWLVIKQELTIGQLIAFNMLLGNVISPFKRLALVWNQLQEILVSVERINDVLESDPEEDLLKGNRLYIEQLRGNICFENVTFRYHPESDNNILENLSFEVKAEQTVAIVGRSGSGKTTLSKLILGLYPPTDGKVLIDGHDVNGVYLKSLRSQTGVVDQDSFLFGGTIRENISIAYPQASLEEIVQAAQLAGADDFIQRLPLGYETQIGEGGGLLSGGQRQRLTIARALLGNPRLILLDEATSNLDSESERIIQNNLKTILKGRTSVIIAHRLSTIRNADLILVLDKGMLVESGTHDELIALKGHYYYLNEQQLAQTG